MKQISYDSVDNYLEWTKVKAKLKFNPESRNFPVINNRIYWAFLGDNIGSEQGKHRPVLVTRTYKNSPICTIIPLTSQRMNDKYWFHVDLENHNSTALCEQMRTIDMARIDTPLREKGDLVSITKRDWEEINKQISWLYGMKSMPQ